MKIYLQMMNDAKQVCITADYIDVYLDRIEVDGEIYHISDIDYITD